MEFDENAVVDELNKLTSAIAWLNIVHDIKFYKLETLLRYFPAQQKEIKQCYYGEYFKSDEEVKTCKEIISSYLYNLLSPFIKEGYHIVDVLEPMNHIILSKDDNPNNNVGVSIGTSSFLKSIGPYVNFNDNKDWFCFGVRENLANNSSELYVNGFSVIYNHKNGNINIKNINTNVQIPFIKKIATALKEYFTEFLPSLTLEETEAYMKNLEMELQKVTNFEDQNQWFNALNNARKYIEDARKEQVKQQNENINNQPNELNEIENFEQNKSNTSKNNKNQNENDSINNNFNFNKECNVVNEVNENNKENIAKPALNNDGEIINDNNINKSSNNTEEKDKKLNSNSSFNQNLDNNNIYSFNQYTFINNNDFHKDNSGPILDDQESNHGCPCPCTCLDTICNWWKGEEKQL